MITEIADECYRITLEISNEQYEKLRQYAANRDREGNIEDLIVDIVIDTVENG